jgi:hypothetical protein
LENGCDDFRVVEKRYRGDRTSRAFAEEGIAAKREVSEAPRRRRNCRDFNASEMEREKVKKEV